MLSVRLGFEFQGSSEEEEDDDDSSSIERVSGYLI
jgi:hypothetical protein